MIDWYKFFICNFKLQSSICIIFHNYKGTSIYIIYCLICLIPKIKRESLKCHVWRHKNTFKRKDESRSGKGNPKKRYGFLWRHAWNFRLSQIKKKEIIFIFWFSSKSHCILFKFFLKVLTLYKVILWHIFCLNMNFILSMLSLYQTRFPSIKFWL